MKIFSFLILYLIFIFTLSAKEPKPQYFVDAKGGLYLREEPSEKSKSILLIPDKSEIRILKEVGGLVEINGKAGNWTEILLGNKKGFVFGAYIRKFFLNDKKFSPDRKFYYESFSPSSDIKSIDCVEFYHDDSDSNSACFVKIFQTKNRKLVRLLNYEDWSNVTDWYDNRSIFSVDGTGDGGGGFAVWSYMNIFTGKYSVILETKDGHCDGDLSNHMPEMWKFENLIFYKITSENPKKRTGYFKMLKPKADDYDKLLETCKRDLKNSVLIKPTTIVRKNYTFKINSKRAAFYFKGKDILKPD